MNSAPEASSVTDARPAAVPPATESEQARRARELTLRARERFDAGDYTAALAEFTRAYETLGQDPRRAALLNNIAVCQERLFRYDLALHSYDRYLREAATDPADRAEVEAVIRGLRGLLGKLHITSNVHAEVWIDDRVLGFAPGDVEVPAGTRVVKLQASGRQGVQRELTVVARTTQTVHFELEALPEYHGVDRRYFWSGVGLTAAALVAGAGLGLSALAKYHDAKALQRHRLLTREAQQPMLRQALAADVCFGAAALFAVSSTVLFFVTDLRRHKGDADARTQVSTPRIGVQASPKSGLFALSFSGGWQ